MNSVKGKYIPPMHLSYIGTSVQDIEDVQVTLIDSGSEGLVVDEAIDEILKVDPDLVGISVTSCDIRRSLQLIILLKVAKPSLLILLGGHHPTAFDWLFLKHVPQVDMILRGEADLSFPELVRRILQDKPIDGVPGLSYRSEGKIIRGKPQLVQDLDSIKFPDRTLFDRRNYFLNVLGIKLGRTALMSSAAIFTSRGCPHKCTFCSKLTPQHFKVRARSPENIVMEILLLNDEGYDLVIFADENFTYDVDRVKRTCELLLEHDLKMRFIFQGTLHNLNQTTLNLMHRAGFDGAIVGVESGCDTMLKRYRKSASSKEIAAGIKRAKKAHMLVHGSFICGGIGETSEDFKKTRWFLKETLPHSCTIYELSIYPNTEIWSNIFGNKKIKTLEDTRNCTISSVPGQTDRASIDREIAKFWKAYALSWFHWKRLNDLFILALNNPMARIAVRKSRIFVFKAFLQLARSRQESH